MEAICDMTAGLGKTVGDISTALLCLGGLSS